MSHLVKFISRVAFRVFLPVSLFVFLFFGQSTQEVYLAFGADGSQQLEETNSSFPVVRPGKFYKHKPAEPAIYQYDASPIGKRTPLLVVHGLRAEYYPYFRWEKVIKHLTASKDFSAKFKIYLARYDSTALMDRVVPQMQTRIGELYHAAGNKPIVILALSMGGNLAYESMVNPETDKQVKTLMAMGTPFHGSPLFCADWLQYGIYKNLSSPMTRIDHAVAYRIYFGHHPNLLYDLRWDNCDYAIPTIGRFASRLPFGPRGNLVAEKAVNQRTVIMNRQNIDKNKLITYSGFIVNVYLRPEAVRVIESTIMVPYTLLTMAVPAHLGREHAVLNMLNRQISTVVTTEEAAKRSKTNFVYALNDGITPITSALFLPDSFCATESIVREADLAKIKPLIDVHKARVFRNIDHLTFIEGTRPIVALPGMRDELNPEEGNRHMFNWILRDLECTEDQTNTRDT